MGGKGGILYSGTYRIFFYIRKDLSGCKCVNVVLNKCWLDIYTSGLPLCLHWLLFLFLKAFSLHIAKLNLNLNCNFTLS